MKLKINILILALMTFINNYGMEKIKLYAFYTPSHTVFVDKWFLPSIKDDYEMIISFFEEQECSTAQFMNEGWKKTTLKKVDMIINAIQENWGKMFVYSDVDIQFFRPTQETILNLIQDNDIVIQRDNPKGQACTGFFACWGNEKILALWQDVKKTMLEIAELSDQKSFNYCLQTQNNPYGIKWTFLPNEFVSGGTLTGKHWKPGQELPIPDNVILHHANWTEGVENKIAQLNYVKDIVMQRPEMKQINVLTKIWNSIKRIKLFN
jgi:hypothetical protein